MDDAKKMELLEDLFEVRPGTISAKTNLRDLTWDSMTMLGLIAVFKSELECKLEVSQLRSFQTIGDILAAMK